MGLPDSRVSMNVSIIGQQTRNTLQGAMYGAREGAWQWLDMLNLLQMGMDILPCWPCSVEAIRVTGWDYSGQEDYVEGSMV